MQQADIDRLNVDCTLLAGELTALTGRKWYMVEEDEMNDWHRYISERATGLMLSVRTDYRNPERLELTGSYRALDFRPSNRSTPTITLSRVKAPWRIARDVNKRLIEKFRPLWQDAKNRYEAHMIEQNACDIVFARLVESAKAEVNDYQETKRHFYHSYEHGNIETRVDVQVYSHDRAEIKINCSIDQAHRVIELARDGNL